MQRVCFLPTLFCPHCMMTTKTQYLNTTALKQAKQPEIDMNNYLKPTLYSLIAAAGLGLFGSGCATPKLSEEKQRSRLVLEKYEELQDAFWRNQIGAYEKDGKRVIVVADGGLENEINNNRITPEGLKICPNDIELEWNRTPINASSGYQHTLTAHSINENLERKRFLEYCWTDDSDTCTITTYKSEGAVDKQITNVPLERGKEQARLFNASWNDERRRTALPVRILLTTYEGTLEGTIEGTPIISAIYRACLDKGRPFEYGEPNNVGGLAGWLGQHKTAEAYHPISWLIDLVRAGITRPLVNLFRTISPGLEERIAKDELEGTDYIILPLKSIAEALDGTLKGNQLDRIILAPVSDINGELGVKSIGDEKLCDREAKEALDLIRAAATITIRTGGATGNANITGGNGGGIGGGETGSNGIGGGQ